MNGEDLYPMWRFMYWTKGNMSYTEIDAAVERGDITPGEMPDGSTWPEPVRSEAEGTGE